MSCAAGLNVCVCELHAADDVQGICCCFKNRGSVSEDKA